MSRTNQNIKTHLANLKQLVSGLSFCLLLALNLLNPNSVKAQSNDLEFANYYYDNGEFDKAILYFEKLNNTQANSYYYQRLLSCFIAVERYEDAENLVKKQLKKAPEKSDVLIDLAAVYRKMNNEKKALKALDDAIDEMPENRGYIAVIARKFIDSGELLYAEKAYQKGELLLKGEYNFAIELADLYGAKGDLPKMIDAFVLLVGSNPAYVPSVQNSLLRYLNFVEEETQADLVKNSLLKALQKEPNNTTYNEMLIWLFYQIKNFNGAFVQLKSLDKRFNEDGNRLLEFARMCYSNEEFTLSAQVFDYLIKEKADPFMQEVSKAGKARAKFLELEQNLNPDPKQVTEVGTLLANTLAEIGINNFTIDNARDYAQFVLKYRNDIDSALALLEKTLATPQLPEAKRADVKLLLGDMFIIKGDIWEASLLYSQVDKSFKEDLLGAEAKFRNAKIAYYSGDFKWAQDQLDVLKASTSKLISNDAMNLSIKITDNLGRDSIEEPLKMYALAELYTFQGLYNEAQIVLDSLSNSYPAHPLADDILYEKAEIARKEKNFSKAAELLEKISSTYATDILGDDATFELAELYETVLNQPEKAQELYQKIITDYPGSLYTVDARKRFRELRGDNKTTPEKAQ